MPNRRDFRYWARWSLLLAALLSFVGAASPALHSHAPGARTAVLRAPGSPGEAPTSHGERICFVCQVLGAAVLPAAEAAFETLWSCAEIPVVEIPAPLALRRASPTRARAPPLFS